MVRFSLGCATVSTWESNHVARSDRRLELQTRPRFFWMAFAPKLGMLGFLLPVIGVMRRHPLRIARSTAMRLAVFMARIRPEFIAMFWLFTLTAAFHGAPISGTSQNCLEKFTAWDHSPQPHPESDFLGSSLHGKM